MAHTSEHKQSVQLGEGNTTKTHTKKKTTHRSQNTESPLRDFNFQRSVQPRSNNRLRLKNFPSTLCQRCIKSSLHARNTSSEQVWPWLHRTDRWYLRRGIFRNISDLIYSKGQELRSTKQVSCLPGQAWSERRTDLSNPPVLSQRGSKDLYTNYCFHEAVGYLNSNTEPAYKLTAQQLQSQELLASATCTACMGLPRAHRRQVGKYSPCTLQVTKRNSHGHAGVSPHIPLLSFHRALQVTEDNFILWSLQSSLGSFYLSLPSGSLRKEQLFWKVILQHVKQLFVFALQN